MRARERERKTRKRQIHRKEKDVERQEAEIQKVADRWEFTNERRGRDANSKIEREIDFSFAADGIPPAAICIPAERQGGV